MTKARPGRFRYGTDFVKVLDLGASKGWEAGLREITLKDIVIGTPRYMAPEQACAERDIDGRVDQFALAAIAYEMLAGTTAFRGDSPVDIITKVALAEVMQLRKLAPWVPEPVSEVVMQALSRRKQDRFASVADFVAALRLAAQSGEASSARG